MLAAVPYEFHSVEVLEETDQSPTDIHYKFCGIQETGTYDSIQRLTHRAYIQRGAFELCKQRPHALQSEVLPLPSTGNPYPFMTVISRLD